MLSNLHRLVIIGGKQEIFEFHLPFKISNFCVTQTVPDLYRTPQSIQHMTFKKCEKRLQRRKNYRLPLLINVAAKCFHKILANTFQHSNKKLIHSN